MAEGQNVWRLAGKDAWPPAEAAGELLRALDAARREGRVPFALGGALRPERLVQRAAVEAQLAALATDSAAAPEAQEETVGAAAAAEASEQAAADPERTTSPTGTEAAMVNLSSNAERRAARRRRVATAAAEADGSAAAADPTSQPAKRARRESWAEETTAGAAKPAPAAGSASPPSGAHPAPSAAAAKSSPSVARFDFSDAIDGDSSDSREDRRLQGRAHKNKAQAGSGPRKPVGAFKDADVAPRPTHATPAPQQRDPFAADVVKSLPRRKPATGPRKGAKTSFKDILAKMGSS